jgi:N-acyl-D-amino-acid deacylase
MTRLVLALLLVPTITLAASSRPTSIPTTKPTIDPNHALIVRNGKIIDGAGNAWFYGDILIRGGTIAAIGKIGPQNHVEEIDATGMVVAPGFIDVHTHVDSDILDSPLAENFVRDGVTSIVTGNCGGSVGDVGKYFAGIRSKGSAINIATLIGHNRILKEVEDKGAADLSKDQLEKGKQIVDQAMRDGAVGMSTGLIYRPGVFSSTEEIIELQKVAAHVCGVDPSQLQS